LYNIKAVNKTRKEKVISISLSKLSGTVTIVGGNLVVPPEGKVESVLFIKLAKKDIKNKHFKFGLNILSNGLTIDKTKVTFIAPN